MNTIRNHAFGPLLLLLFACAMWMSRVSHQLSRSQANERTLALKSSNLEAMHDSTRDLAHESARVATLLGDSLHAYERRAVQQPQRDDALDSAAGTHRSAAYQLGFKLGKFLGELTKPRRDTVPFHVRQEPYTIDAVVSQPPGGDSTNLRLSVALDSIPMRVRVGCRPTGDAGISSAHVMLTAPPWATVQLGGVEQAPGICNPGAALQPPTKRRLITWAPLALSVGRQLGPGAQGWTAQLGTAIVFGAR